MPRPRPSPELALQRKRAYAQDQARRRAGWKLTEDEYQEGIAEGQLIVARLVRLIGAQRVPPILANDIDVWEQSMAVKVSLAPSDWNRQLSRDQCGHEKKT